MDYEKEEIQNKLFRFQKMHYKTVGQWNKFWKSTRIDTSLIFVQPITNFFLLVNAENDVVFQQGTKKDRSTCIEILRV